MKTKQRPRRDYTKLWNRPGFLIRRLHQIQVAMFLEECNEYNITPVQFGVLTVLYGQDPLDQITIANQIGIDRNTAADVIRRLEKRGLLVRPPSVVDKRAKLARITEQGSVFVEAVQPEMIKAQRRFIDPLTRDERETLMQLMRKLVEANNDAGRAPFVPTD